MHACMCKHTSVCVCACVCARVCACFCVCVTSRGSQRGAHSPLAGSCRINKPREPEGGAQPPGRVLPDKQAAGARGGGAHSPWQGPAG